MIDGYVRKWLVKASNDLKVAEHEMSVSPTDMVTKEFVLAKLEVR